MQKNMVGISCAIALFGIAAAQASDFDGGYLGGKVGYNKNKPETSATSNKVYPGIEAGYGWDMNGMVLGVDAFLDGHTKSITGKDYGADLKLGFPSSDFMPYVKLGLAGSDPGTRVHGGVGVEYKFSPQWSITGEWTADSKTVNSVKNTNSNISLGINYYFDKPHVAPAIVAIAAPVIVKKPEPIAPPKVVAAPPPPPEPVSAPVTPPKTIFTDKPITIQGASFDTNSAKLKPSAFKQLDEVVDFSVKYEDADLTVVGFTDSMGNEKANQLLSTRRAESVKAYLVNRGVSANRIITSGKGSASPIGDNKTAAGRTKNRRVEINSVVRVPQ